MDGSHGKPHKCGVDSWMDEGAMSVVVKEWCRWWRVCIFCPMLLGMSSR